MKSRYLILALALSLSAVSGIGCLKKKEKKEMDPEIKQKILEKIDSLEIKFKDEKDKNKDNKEDKDNNDENAQ